MGVASLVLGIASIMVAFVPFVGLTLGIVGIILGALARKEDQSGVAMGGLVTSIIGTSIALFLTFACFACFAGMKKAFDLNSTDPAQIKQSFQSIDEFTKKLKEMEKEANKK